MEQERKKLNIFLNFIIQCSITDYRTDYYHIISDFFLNTQHPSEHECYYGSEKNSFSFRVILNLKINKVFELNLTLKDVVGVSKEQCGFK